MQYISDHQQYRMWKQNSSLFWICKAMTNLKGQFVIRLCFLLLYQATPYTRCYLSWNLCQFLKRGQWKKKNIQLQLQDRENVFEIPHIQYNQSWSYENFSTVKLSSKRWKNIMQKIRYENSNWLKNSCSQLFLKIYHFSFKLNCRG